MKKQLFLYSLIFLLIIAKNACYAQVSIPSNVDPGFINADIKMKLAEPPREKKDETPVVDFSKIITQENIDSLQSDKFLLNKINFTGNTVLKTKELEELSKNLIGKEITLEDIGKLINEINQIYKKEGYLTSTAYILPQVIEGGIVEISIIEGKVGNIIIHGGKWAKNGYIKKNILKANKIKEANILNINNLNESIAEINSVKYLKGNIILEKGEKTGETDILLDLKDRFPLSFSAGWDNQGRDIVGVQRATIRTSVDNVSGWGDKIWADNIFASGTHGLNSGYLIPLGDKGTKLKFEYSLSNTKLGQDYKEYDITGRSHNFAVAVEKPIYKSSNLKLNSRVAFDFIHSGTKIHDEDLNKYEIRALRTGLTAQKDDKTGKWLGNFTVSTGIPLFGAVKNKPKGIPDSEFVKFNTSLVRFQQLPKDCAAILKASSQFSTNTLFSAEQMDIGGVSSVRGYDEGALLGDMGYNISLETRTPIPFLPKSLNIPLKKDKIFKIPVKDSVRFAVFYDQGWTKTIQQRIPVNYTNFFQSIGVGLRISIKKYTTVNLDLGIPLGKKRYGGQQDAMFHFSLTTDIL